MGAPKKADWREERRKRAWALKQEGWPQKGIAAALGVSDGAISQWMKRAREGGGVETLTRQPPPGMRPRLRADQRTQLPGVLVGGAEAHGFRGDVWAAKRVATVIWRHFGVRYHPDHDSRVLRRLAGVGSSPSNARRNATRRRSSNGRRSAGPGSKKGPRRRIHHRLGR
jgi:transposase